MMVHNEDYAEPLIHAKQALKAMELALMNKSDPLPHWNALAIAVSEIRRRFTNTQKGESNVRQSL